MGVCLVITVAWRVYGCVLVVDADALAMQEGIELDLFS